MSSELEERVKRLEDLVSDQREQQVKTLEYLNKLREIAEGHQHDRDGAVRVASHVVWRWMNRW
jgi:hypothetical protein